MKIKIVSSVISRLHEGRLIILRFTIISHLIVLLDWHSTGTCACSWRNSGTSGSWRNSSSCILIPIAILIPNIQLASVSFCKFFQVSPDAPSLRLSLFKWRDRPDDPDIAKLPLVKQIEMEFEVAQRLKGQTFVQTIADCTSALKETCILTRPRKNLAHQAAGQPRCGQLVQFYSETSQEVCCSVHPPGPVGNQTRDMGLE